MPPARDVDFTRRGAATGRHARSLRVAVYPEHHPNAVVANLRSVLGAIPGVDMVPLEPWNVALRARGLWSGTPPVDILVLNWPELALCDTRGRLTARGIARYLTKMALFSRRGGRLIYVRHNRAPHGLHPSDAPVAEAIIDQVASRCAAQVCFAEGNAKGIPWVPHPLYTAGIQDAFPPQKPHPSDYCVIFGNIEPRKKADSFIHSWPPCGPRLRVAGHMPDRGYVAHLRTLARHPRVEFCERPLSEADARELVAGARALLLTHTCDNAFVSASFFFALSVGTPVFSPREAYLQRLVALHRFPGIHLYDSPAEAIERIARSAPTAAERGDILQAADAHFGRARSVEAWTRVLADAFRARA